METWTDTLTLGALVALLTLAACETEAPDVAAVPEPAPGDPAVYAPDGWPLQIGDKISTRRLYELNAEFVSLGSVWGVHVVGDRTYAARYGHGNGALADEAPEYRLPPELSALDGHYIYEGHFRVTVPDRYREDEHLLPEHLQGRIEYHPMLPKVGPHPGAGRTPSGERSRPPLPGVRERPR